MVVEEIAGSLCSGEKGTIGCEEKLFAMLLPRILIQMLHEDVSYVKSKNDNIEFNFVFGFYDKEQHERTGATVGVFSPKSVAEANSLPESERPNNVAFQLARAIVEVLYDRYPRSFR